MLTFKFSATVPTVPERSSTTSDGSSVIPFLEHPRDVPVGSSFSAAFQCSSARHTSHANRWNRVPTVAAKIDEAGRAEPAECRAKPTENNAEPESDRRKRTEGADAGPAFAEPEQAFAANLFATTVHLLDGY